MLRPARRHRRVQLEARDQAVAQQRDFVRVDSMFFQRLDGFADISAREAKALGGRPHVLRLDPVVIQTTCEYRRQTGEPGFDWGGRELKPRERSEEHTSELQSLMRNSYAVFCLKKKNKPQQT